MGILKTDPDKQAAKDEARAARAQAKADAKQQREYEEFLMTPVGRARSAYERGDHVYQYSLDVMSQVPTMIKTMNSIVTAKTTDPSVVVNAVCSEGWEIINGSFVFVESGSQSRNKMLGSGENVSVQGTTVGYYLFKRCEASRREINVPALTEAPGLPAISEATEVRAIPAETGSAEPVARPY